MQKAAGFYSKHVLRNKPTLKASIDDISKKFKSLNIKMRSKIRIKIMYIYIYRVIDKLTSTIIQHIYGYDSTYKIKFGKVLTVVCPLLHL